jgi:hypothetical protein
MPNNKPNTHELTFEYMQILIRSFLKRGCGCKDSNSNSCPLPEDGSDQWHTWRRLKKNGDPHKTDACCFVKPDHISLNIHDKDASTFKMEMIDAGWTVEVNDPRSPMMTRYNVCTPNMIATNTQLTVLKKWVLQTVGAF